VSWRALVEQTCSACTACGSRRRRRGLVELAILLEETAFGLLPGPLLPTVLTSLLVSQHAGPELRERCCQPSRRARRAPAPPTPAA